jgi:monofunctional glycosyltransferase
MLLRSLRRIWLVVTILVAAPVVLGLAYWIVTPVSTLMAWRTVTGERVERIALPLSGISRSVPRAVIASEDARFCHHWGVDWRELLAVVNDEDGPSRGASTISMQVARNLFLWQGDSGITAYLRKVLEIPLALVLDLVWSKRRMMEIYLNIAEWGPNGEFGIEAGSRRAFRKPAAGLSPSEAAMMVAILPNPLTRDARAPGPGVRRKAAIISRRAASATTDCL